MHDHHDHHDSNSHPHCHCDSCSIQQTTGDAPAASARSAADRGEHGSGEDSPDDPGDSDPSHKHGPDRDGPDSCHGHHEHHEHHEHGGGCCCGGDDDEDGCGCGHDHGGKPEKGKIITLAAAGLLLIPAMAVPMAQALRFVLCLAAYLLAGGEVLLRAGRNMAKGRIFDENFLMALATVGAFLIGEYPEGVAVMLFYQVGELFQSYAVGRSRRSIAQLMDIRPDSANLWVDGAARTVPPDQVEVGDEILIRPGEKIPLDCVLLEGQSLVDTAALTGESVPRTVRPGDELLSGCVNQTGLLRARVTREFGQSTVARILELVENAADKKARSEQFITRFARYYTPAVVAGAALLAVVPPLLFSGDWYDWVYRALTFLVISCPCALVISVPLSFFGGIGAASRMGILVKGSNYLEALAKADLVVFDKTGTLTQGVFRVTEIHPVDRTEEELLELAAQTEQNSTHPIAASILEAWGRALPRRTVEEYTQLPGLGISCRVDGRRVLSGNRRLMDREGVLAPEVPEGGTVVHLAADGAYAGYVLIADQLKPDAGEAIRRMKALGVRRTVMLTGDAQGAAAAAAQAAGVDEYAAGLLPGDKVDRVEALLTQKSPKGTLVFVGDGVNDAPVLARADVGVAMGDLGSDAAIEAADVVLMHGRPSRLADGVRVARKTMSIVRQNIVFALGVKAVVLLLGAMGGATMWAAVFADVGVSLLAILNALRALGIKSDR